MSDALLDNWDHAIENFATFVSTVDDWEIASPCPGWSVSDLVAHIIDLESQLAGDPQPEHTPDWSSLTHVSSDFGRFNEIGVDAHLLCEVPQRCFTSFCKLKQSSFK